LNKYVFINKYYIIIIDQFLYILFIFFYLKDNIKDMTMSKLLKISALKSFEINKHT